MAYANKCWMYCIRTVLLSAPGGWVVLCSVMQSVQKTIIPYVRNGTGPDGTVRVLVRVPNLLLCSSLAPATGWRALLRSRGWQVLVGGWWVLKWRTRRHMRRHGRHAAAKLGDYSSGLRLLPYAVITAHEL